ncbi:SGNH/GDSL hydrolase family protein [Arthrobacter halodurans]|uniref:SGNH/GDSL hydrolase family protein n=1 Tax=Arthrobacter halodurans TaxID=516699 RepID=A0ABV4USY4_9MICC
MALVTTPDGATTRAPAEDTAPSAVFLDPDAKPILSWNVPGRFEASWKAYNHGTGLYDKNFVNPTNWAMTLNACASGSKRRIIAYTFTLTKVGDPWSFTRRTPACQLKLNILKSPGLYKATLAVHTDWGAGTEGVSPLLNQSVDFKDRLIVAMGDSLASGEGSPDKPGSYKTSENWKGEIKKTGTIEPVQWESPQCHRSKLSGPARAAKALENSHTSVTFISAACSGAELWHLIDTPYAGREALFAPLPPQVDAIKHAVGVRGRPIDALVIAAGLNDLNFSTIIENCSTNWKGGNCVEKPACWPGGKILGTYFPPKMIGRHLACFGDGGIADQMKQIPDKYAALAGALRTKLPGVRSVHLTSYPAKVFKGGACGSLHFNGVGISAKEGARMAAWGSTLSTTIAAASTRHGWSKPVDLTPVFERHSYCAGWNGKFIPPSSDGWFKTYEWSWRLQGDKFGTAHPNPQGHRAYGDEILRNIRLR